MTRRRWAKAAVSLFAAISLAACASTPTSPAETPIPLTVNPVMSSSNGTIDIPTVLNTAKISYGTGSYAESHALYQSILLQHPDHMKAQIGFADTALALGKYDVALTIFQRLSLGVETGLQDREVRSTDMNAISAGLRP